MEDMMRSAGAGPMVDSDLPSWKLYDNPHFSEQCHNFSHKRHHHPYNNLSKSKSSIHPRRFMITSTMGNHSELDVARAQIKELKAELEFERRMRRKIESMNKVLSRELAEQKKEKEAAEDACKRLANETSCMREEADRTVREAEEERRMLMFAEVLREERVQMKLTEARLLMEEKVNELTKEKEEFNLSKLKNLGPTSGEGTSGDGTRRKEVENPHIMRGIKGFVEFPRAVRVRASGMGSSPSSSREGRGHLGSNLECQRAQLRVLLRHKNPVDSGLMGRAENLVM